MMSGIRLLMPGGVSLCEVYESMRYADLVLTCGDGQAVGHKSVLASISPFLSILLQDNPQSHELIIPDVQASSMVQILQLIYTGETRVASQRDLSLVIQGIELLQIQAIGELSFWKEQNDEEQNLEYFAECEEEPIEEFPVVNEAKKIKNKKRRKMAIIIQTEEEETDYVKESLEASQIDLNAIYDEEEKENLYENQWIGHDDVSMVEDNFVVCDQVERLELARRATEKDHAYSFNIAKRKSS